MLNPLFLARMKEYLKSEYDLFLESYNEENVRGLRVNSKYFFDKSFEDFFDYKVEKIMGLDNCYYLLDNNLKLGFHPLHHAGLIYMQDPSAMLPAYSIDIKSDAKVLDLCSAPGGKATQLASIVKDGFVIANEIDFTRCKALYSNVERLGLSNVIVTNNKPSDFLKDFKNKFDVILVDAPCSGEGMFRKYPESHDNWSLEEVKLCSSRDKEILDIAFELLAKDGILIYSTCTFSYEENEEIIKYLLDNYNFSQIDVKDEIKPFVKEGFIPLTYRFYPHLSKGEGQFLAVLKKNDGIKENFKEIKKFDKLIEFDDFSKKFLNTKFDKLYRVKDDIFLLATNIDLKTLKVLNYGVKLGEIFNKRFIPNHYMFKALPHVFKSSINLDYKDELVTKYLHGKQIEFDCIDGFGVLMVNDIPLGGYKASNGKVNNHYPKGLRNF